MNIVNCTPYLPSSKPITIVEKKKKDLLHSFQLNLSTFDPNKCSPPSNWTARLLHRFYGDNINMGRNPVIK